MEVIELRNPKALMVAEIQGLFKRMTERVSFAAPGGFDSIAPDLYRYVTSDGYFVLLGFENGSPKALAMGFFPGGAPSLGQTGPIPGMAGGCPDMRGWVGIGFSGKRCVVCAALCLLGSP